MPYADTNKQKEYDKLRRRRERHSQLDVPNKTILEQLRIITVNTIDREKIKELVNLYTKLTRDEQKEFLFQIGLR